ncbi:hypothetical protein GCM10010307_40340 [Streptomyces vastus]|uniref:Uncharacterized protein n=1 Tax=Streptomyces vastus TaxID=285451 RepID=A0ABP6DF70_9ACTN
MRRSTTTLLPVMPPIEASGSDNCIGFPPAFFPNGTEAVWELAEHLYVCIEQQVSDMQRGL